MRKLLRDSVNQCLMVCSVMLCMHAINMISVGVIQSRLQDRLGRNFFGSVHEIVVTVKLHLIMPNAEKKSPVSREVTTANYRECFSLIRESALFHFGAFNIAHDDTGIEGTIEVKLGN